ncbi:MAG: AtpZ/AtpI family protein [Chloroflexota bacterium]
MSQEPQINQSALLAGIVGQVGCMTIILIGLAFGAGWLLDRYLETKPVFTILFLVGSVPVTLFITVRLTLTAAARAQRSNQSKKP